MAPRESLGRKWNFWLRPSTHSLLALTLVFSLLSSANAQYYFIINQPTATTSWANGSPYPFSWTKGLLDGVDSFDIELTRLNEDGLFLVAQNVPATYNTLNILLQDVPEGDDYFLLCVNSTHSLVYAVSPRFTVTNSSSTQSNPSPDASVPTVTVSGAPDPLKQFAATLAATNDGSSLVLSSPNTRVLGFGGILALCAAFLGGVMTLC